jgi:N-acetylglutamate synthase-like GNAT family acetyltransferase
LEKAPPAVKKPSTEVRQASPADEAAIRSVLDCSYRTLLSERYGVRQADEIAKYATADIGGLLRSGRYYVAIREGRVVASGGWSDQSPLGIPLAGSAVFVRRFAVLPGNERQGLGRTLFTACRKAAAQTGASTFYVRSTINAETFYRSLEFQVIERTLIALPDGAAFPAILMKRTG